MTIKQRMFLLAAIITVAVLSMLVLQQYTTNRSDLLRRGITTLFDVEADMQAMLAIEREYLLTHSPKSSKNFYEEEAELIEELHELDEILTQLGLDSSPLKGIYLDLDTLASHFSELEKLIEQIGLDENQGLRGSLRQAAHQVEKVFRQTNNAPLLVELLMLRRHEKDFLLRLDAKYVDRHNKVYRELTSQIEQTSLDATRRDSIINNLTTYTTNFHTLVETKKRLGFREGDGLRAKLGGSIDRVLKNQKVLATHTSETIKQARINQDKVIFSGTLLLIITLVGMAL
ncbi:MAG TPA: hypothetical protein ENJ65_06870, partial [Candidatus Tenderia electrophaga]|nr:hypothetical protein [Candidatus Tenderia electrophaga]